MTRSHRRTARRCELKFVRGRSSPQRTSDERSASFLQHLFRLGARAVSSLACGVADDRPGQVDDPPNDRKERLSATRASDNTRHRVAQKRSRTVERTASNRHPLKAPDRPPPKGSMPAQPASATPALEHRFSGPDSARSRPLRCCQKAGGQEVTLKAAQSGLPAPRSRGAANGAPVRDSAHRGQPTIAWEA